MHSNTSMYPLIAPNDIPTINKAKKYSTNDIVAYKKSSNLIAHRIVYLHPKNKWLLTKGDNNYKVDKKVFPHQILGKVTSISRGDQHTHLDHIYLTQSTIYLQIIKTITKTFAKKSIKHIFIKGLPTHLYYKNQHPKHIFLDIDILIHKQDLKKARKLLKTIGFNKQLGDKKLQSSKLPTQIHLSMPSKPFPIILDIHLEVSLGFTKSTHLNSLLPSSSKLSKYFFKNSSVKNISKQNISILNPQAQITLLLTQLYHQNFKQLHKFEIIKDIANKSQINWDKILSDSKKLNIAKITHTSLILYHSYYPGVIPERVIKLARKYYIKPVILLSKLSSPFNSQDRIFAGIYRLFLVFITSEKSLSTKIRVVFNSQTLKISYSTIKSFLFNSSTKTS